MSPSLFSPGAPGFRAESTYSFTQSPPYAWFTKIRIEPPQRAAGHRALKIKPAPSVISMTSLARSYGWADFVCERRANQKSLAKTECNPDNVRPLGMKAYWD